MSKKDKNKIIIVLLYFVSFFIFDLVMLISDFGWDIRKIVGGYYNPFALLASFAEAGVYHFILVSCIAIFVKFSKRIDNEYKHIIYWFPLCTFILALPMSIPTAIILRTCIYLSEMNKYIPIVKNIFYVIKGE